VETTGVAQLLITEWVCIAGVGWIGVHNVVSHNINLSYQDLFKLLFQHGTGDC
jgi:hypothetical protein